MGLPPADYDPQNFSAIYPANYSSAKVHNSVDVAKKCYAKDAQDTDDRHSDGQSRFEVVNSARTSLSIPGGGDTATGRARQVSERFGHEEGDGFQSRLAAFVTTNQFQYTTLFVIVLNGFWIAIDIEWNHANLKENGKLPLEPASIYIENVFCAYFTLEITIRLLAYRSWRFMVRDAWLLFDGVLVLFMIIETWVLPLVDLISGGGEDGFLSKFSCLRLLRLTRLTRIMNSLPELLTLVKGIANATRAVAAVLVFMVLIMYVFSIVFTGQLGDSKAPEYKLESYWDRGDDPTGVELFGSIGDSMMTLFTRGTLGDNLAETLTAIKDRGGDWVCEDADGERTCTRTGGHLWLMWLFIFFMILSAFCILNMLVGILCEVIQETANEEQEKGMLARLRHNIEESFHHIDVSGDEIVTHAEWVMMRNEEPVRDCFLQLGVEIDDLDLRLDQMEECFFGVCAKDRMIRKSEQGKSILKLSRSNLGEEEAVYRTPSAKKQGLRLADFIEKVLETRPDSPASFLDVEIMRVRALKDEATFNSQLDNIENVLKDVLHVQNSLSKEKTIIQTTKAPSDDLALNGDDSRENEEVSDAWLHKLSTEAIFEELIERKLAKPRETALDID